MISDYGVWDAVMAMSTPRGQVIQLGGYTYSFVNRTSRVLRCSKKMRGQCPAKIKVDREGNICYADTAHNHPPPDHIYVN